MVKSGKDTGFTATIYLVAGRIYPLRLEYSKAKQGVNDQGKKKGKPRSLPSSITLLWKVPAKALEPIAQRLPFDFVGPRSVFLLHSLSSG